MKRLIIAALALLTLSGCGSPYIQYHKGGWDEGQEITLRDGYKINGHQFVETEGGYDLVIHFVEEETP